MIAVLKYHRAHMHPSYWLLVCLVAVCCVSAVRAQCTKSTCEAGPVTAIFPSIDCTGDGEYYQEVTESTLDLCQAEGTSSFRYVSTSDSLTYSSANNLYCDTTWANATYTIRQEFYGICAPYFYDKRDSKGASGSLDKTTTRAATSSYMVLPSVNASYTAPQNLGVDLSYPNVDTTTYMATCTTPTNCTRPNGEEASIITSKALGSCTPWLSTGTYNLSLDFCYRKADTHYIATSCIAEDAYIEFYYTGNGCQNLFQATSYRQACDPQSSSTIYTCLGPIHTPSEFLPQAEPPTSAPASSTPTEPSSTTPSAPSMAPTSTPSAPTSTSPSFLPSSLLVLASTLALLF